MDPAHVLNLSLGVLGFSVVFSVALVRGILLLGFFSKQVIVNI